MNEILHATGTRLTQLRAKLAAREGKPGMEKNCEAIKTEIARLEGDRGAGSPGGGPAVVAPAPRVFFCASAAPAGVRFRGGSAAPRRRPALC